MAQITLNSTGVASSGALVLQSNGTTTAVTINSSQGVEFNAGTAALPAITTTGDTNTGIFFPAADTIAFSEGGAEAMRIDSSGNLGVGTTSQYGSQKLSVNGGIALDGRSAATPGLSEKSDDNTGIFWPAADTLGFTTNGTERIRIDSSGNLLVGTTATDSGAKTRIVYGASSNGIQVKDSADTSNTAFVIFQNGSNSNIGTISRVGTTNVVAYNTTSDERLKNDLGVAVSDTVIDALVIHDFSWKTDGTLDRGVFAQEAAIVKPLAVREGSNELDENGVPKNPWGVDYSKFVPDLIVYCQQLKNQVQQLQADVAALKA